jgi:hypothetical protein
MKTPGFGSSLPTWAVLWLGLTLGLTGCGLRNDEVAPTEEFSKIYNNPAFDNIVALDAQQTADGGYIILGYLVRESGNGQRVPYLLKVSPTGQAEWDTNAQAEFGGLANPVGQLRVQGDEYTFLCAQAGQLVLVRVHEARRRPEVVRQLGGSAARPLFAQPTADGGLLLLATQPNCAPLAGQATQLIKTDASLAPVLTRCYPGALGNQGSLGNAADEFAYAGEVTIRGRRLFFFQAWLNDEWTLTFVDAASGDLVQSYAFTDPVSRVKTLPNGFLPLGETAFATAFTNNTTVLLNARATLLSPSPTDDTRFSAPGDPFHELRPDRRVPIRTMRVGGREVVAFAAPARNNQIAVFLFQAGTSNLRGRTYLGSTNPYVPNALLQTADGGLAVVGTTTVAGRFARIVLIKLSAGDLANLNAQCQGLGLCD